MPDGTSRRPAVPDLASGVTRLVGDENRGVALRAVAVNELSREDSDTPAYWIDVGGAATTRGLYDLGFDPTCSPELRIARAFTAYQHVTLIERLTERVSADTPLVVCSNVARLYDDGDLRRGEARELLDAAMERLSAAVATHDVPTVLTVGSPDDRRLAGVIDGVTNHTVRCRPTRLGLRFSGENFETASYDAAWGDRQTTFEYWDAVAVERAAATRWADDADEQWVEQPLEPMGPLYPTVG